MALLDAATKTCGTKHTGFSHGQKKTAWWTEEIRQVIAQQTKHSDKPLVDFTNVNKNRPVQ
jgi:hypothetical protein